MELNQAQLKLVANFLNDIAKGMFLGSFLSTPSQFSVALGLIGIKVLVALFALYVSLELSKEIRA